MPVNVIGTLKPKNNGKFPVAEAVDIKVTENLRLDEALENKADLVTLNYALANKADKTTTTALQAQIDNIVSGSTEDSEVINARVGADGTSYNTLKARLDAEQNADASNFSTINTALFSHNLFDKSTFTVNSERNASTGEITPNSGGYGVSALIPVKPETTLYFSYDGVALAPVYVYVYKADGTFGSRQAGATTFTTTATTGYISVCIKNGKADKFQVEYTNVTPYEKYGVIANNLELSQLNSEIADINNVLKSTNLYDSSKFIKNAERNHSTGAIEDNTHGYGVSDLIPVSSGKKVYFSENGNALTPAFIYLYDTSGNYLSRLAGSADLYIESTYGYISVCIQNTKASKFQVEYDHVSPYNPFNYDMRDTVDKLEYFITKGNAENPLEIIKETPGYLSAFLTVGCIGDSLASGLSTGFKDGTKYNLNLYDHSWGQCLARATGNTYYNFSVGGLSTRTWLASQYATQCYDGEHNCTAYIIGLGQNDMNTEVPIGSIADIHDDDYTLNADTFYGNYGKIIQKIKEMFPGTKPKIFVVTDPLEAVETAGYNAAIRAIAEHFANTWLIDMYTYGRAVLDKYPLSAWKRDAHYNAMGYQYFSWAIATYIDWIIRKHFDYFKDVELIGTEYTYHTTENQ